MRRPRLAALAALAALAVLADTALADGKEDAKRRQVVDRLARRLGVPADDLAAVGGERYVARDPAPRRALLAQLGAVPRGPLLPLVVDAALEEADFEARRAAVRLLSVVGLEADRAEYLGRVVPALPRLLADRSELITVDAADELLRLERWFACDEDVAPLLERVFAGADLKTAARGFAGLCALAHPALRAGPATRAIVAVLDRKSRFASPERKRAVLAVATHRDAATPQALAALLHEDGTIAVEIARTLERLGDPTVVPVLRRVDRTSAHVLRIPAYLARGALGDEALLAELGPALETDHVAIRLALIEAVGRLRGPRPGQVLERLARTLTDDALRRSVALARLRRGDPADLEVLRPLVAGAARDGAWSDRVLGVEDPGAGPLVLAIARDDGQSGARRERAVDLLGDARRADDEARALLRRVAAEGGPSALRLRAAASLLQLGAEGAVAAVESALVDLDVVAREDAPTPVGTARRFAGGPLLEVADRWAAAGTLAAAPLLARWLDPPAPASPPPAPGGEGSAARPAAPAAAAARPPGFLAHPFVRRGAVAALGALAAAQPEADRGPAIAALARALDDPAGVVRAAAVRALAGLSGVDRLPPGASVAAEEEVRTRVRTWLAGR